ncbi:MAG: hypothetical protein D8M57_16605 [Candidatus Scalindua sp. AMX11]|nr:MAG: hypothetical protein DWQ00_06620 [Candidatus Scalindua sp.]NOG84260.1 hypothetical protein [Planctomycetota bacterium]RZV68293.1 MAG: hypothetical protein EX341_16615 [Candidatus Scalindua sp. SCAELEC01]TDE63760.1 MAG: hypothetical protein D8M57_16605 [Candidatus Scalindua sp. AMX11]GJQ60716.1 MAG: hypothetical protein SCALA701_35170 [Candidatus Scalindua sp.]
MKKFMTSFTFFGLIVCVIVISSGCKYLSRTAAIPEPVGNYVVLVYELPFIYEEDNSRQEQFLSTIRTVVAPANWKKGPDTMFAITNILVVSTTPQNHMHLERFFDSLPDIIDEQPPAWIEILEEKKRAK